MARIVSAVTLLLLLLEVPACSDSTKTSRSLSASADREAREDSSKPALDPDNVHVTLEWTTRASADAGRLLASVEDIVVAPRGEILVSDPASGNVKLFDSDGRFVRLIGRSGKGPGEFAKTPAAFNLFLALRAPDTLYVADNMLMRVQRFTLDGSYHGWLMIPQGALYYMVMPDGFVYEATRRRRAANNPFDEERAMTFFRLDGTSWKVVGTRRVPGMDSITFSKLFTAEGKVAATPSGTFIVGSGGECEYEELDLSLNLRRTVRWHCNRPELPVSAHEPTLLYMVHAGVVNKVPDSAVKSMAKEAAEAQAFPSRYPAYVHILVADDGKVWLQRPITTDDIQAGAAAAHAFWRLGSTRWDVFTPEGKYLAIVNFPSGFELHCVAKDAAYGANVNEDGETVVQKIRVSFGQ
jgi:hypothetical protein